MVLLNKEKLRYRLLKIVAWMKRKIYDDLEKEKQGLMKNGEIYEERGALMREIAMVVRRKKPSDEEVFSPKRCAL